MSGGYEGPKEPRIIFHDSEAMHAMSGFSSRIRDDTVIFVTGVGYVHGACQS